MGHSHPQLEGCARGVTNDEKVALKYSWTFSAVMGGGPNCGAWASFLHGGSELVSTRDPSRSALCQAGSTYGAINHRPEAICCCQALGFKPTIDFVAKKAYSPLSRTDLDRFWKGGICFDELVYSGALKPNPLRELLSPDNLQHLHLAWTEEGREGPCSTVGELSVYAGEKRRNSGRETASV